MIFPFEHDLKKEVTFTITPPMREEGYVRVSYSFIKDSEDITIADHFDFKDGKFVFKWDDEFHKDFGILVGLLEGGMEALEAHINKCYQTGKCEPLTLKTNPKFLNEADREYLTDEQLEEESSSEVLKSIWKAYYNGKVLREFLKDWSITEITREQFPFNSREEDNDLDFAYTALCEHFSRDYSMFIKYQKGKAHFYVVRIPERDKRLVYVYVEGGESFGNWLLARSAFND